MTDKKFIIEARIMYDLDFAKKCLIVLYDQQTRAEQDVQTTLETNSVGFNKSDGDLLTRCAQIVSHGEDLMPNKWGLVQSRLLKYAGQLTTLLTDDEIES